MEIITIPDIEVPFPRNRHSGLDQARSHTRSWATAMSLLAPDLASRFLDELRYTELIGGYYVGAPLPVLKAINDFSLWFFVWDDRHDRYIVRRRYDAWSTLREALHLALDEPTSHLHKTDPLVAAFADCVIRLYQPLSARWNSRFAAHFHATIDAYDQEFCNRTAGIIPTVEQYLVLRRHTFGMRVWIDCLELAANYELPGIVYASAPYQTAATASQEFSAWYNDLHSIQKEIAVGDFHNLGIVLANQEQLTIRKAVDRVAEKVQDRLVAYQTSEGRVRRHLNDIAASVRLCEGVERCLFNMRNWISSVHGFHHESSRYQVNSWTDPARPPYIHDPDNSEYG